MKSYKSKKKALLFWLLVFSSMVALWLLWLGADAYILTRDPLSSLESSRAILMAVLVVMLFFMLLGGLVLAVLIENRRYVKYFSVFIALLLATLLAFRAFFG